MSARYQSRRDSSNVAKSILSQDSLIRIDKGVRKSADSRLDHRAIQSCGSGELPDDK